MAVELVDKGDEPGSWTDLPDDRDSEDGESVAPDDKVGEIADQVRRRLRRASRALAPPGANDLSTLLSGVNLPAIESEQTLENLAARLDAESDLWRGLALRALARATWADRFTQGIAVLAAIGCVALASVAAFVVLFGAEGLLGRTLLLVAAAAVLVAGAAAVAMSSAGVRRAQRSIATRALSRADLAELRLHRVGVVMAQRAAGDEALYREALARLETEVGGLSKQR